MNYLRFDGFVLDAHLRQLRRDGERVPLPAKAFDLLWFLCENPGRPLSKSDLMAAVWPDAFVEESNLTNNIFLLRKALGRAAESSIITLPGRGYQLAAIVTAVEQEGPAVSSRPAFAIPAPASIDASRSSMIYEEITEERVGFLRSPVLLGLAAASALAMAAAGWLGWQRWEDRVGGPPVQLVIADLDGTTGDSVLDRTLTTITRSELGQSPFVSLLPTAALRATLQQMLRKPTDPVTVALAREACERTGSQAVLHESVTRAGSGFVLTEEATNCVDGSSLALVHEEAAKAEDLPGAISKADAVVRHGVGESHRTIARFNAPLTPANTASLDALKDYSQASSLAAEGHFPEAIELQKQAIALDPGFAAAYLDLSGLYLNSLDPVSARPVLQKAYDLRDSATEPGKLYVTARYHTYITGDLYESMRNYRAWIAMYPRQVQPWSGLSNIYTELGQPAEALDAAEHVLQLAPTNSVAYQSLAAAQIAAGDFPAARITCQLGLSKHFDTESIHYLLLRLAYLQKDETLLQQEQVWVHQQPDSPTFLGNQALYALQQGRMREGERLLQAMADAFAHQGNAEAGLRIQQLASEAFAGLNNLSVAQRLLRSAPPSPTEEGYLNALILTGDAATAEKWLAEQLVLHPRDTQWNGVYKPLLLAGIAIHTGRPAEALAALESAQTFNHVGSGFYYLRGTAYLQLKRMPEAENEFRTLLAHPEIEANGYELPLARLQLARTLGAEGKRTESAAEYRAFLSSWSNADPDQPLLAQARHELAVLR